MLCMDELSLPSLQRLIFSKSTVVKNLAKGKTKVKRESSFTFPFSYPFTPSINEHKYILFRSLLSHFNSTGLYIYLDVNTYVPPALFSRLLSILRVSAGSSPDPVISSFFCHIVALHRPHARSVRIQQETPLPVHSSRHNIRGKTRHGCRVVQRGCEEDFSGTSSRQHDKRAFRRSRVGGCFRKEDSRVRYDADGWERAFRFM